MKWRTRKGKIIDVTDMKDDHLLNAIRMMRKHAAKKGTSVARLEENRTFRGLTFERIRRGLDELPCESPARLTPLYLNIDEWGKLPGAEEPRQLLRGASTGLDDLVRNYLVQSVNSESQRYRDKTAREIFTESEREARDSLMRNCRCLITPSTGKDVETKEAATDPKPEPKPN